MEKISPQTLLSALNRRYAVKKFDSSRKISDADWAALEETLRLSPSSYGLQPWKFIVVQSPDIRKELTPVSWGQQQIEAASHLVVLTHLKTVTEDYVDRFIRSTAQIRSMEVEKLTPYRNMIVNDVVDGPRSAIVESWAARQVYIAFGAFMTAAALLQVDTCPLEGLDPSKYDEILGLTDTPYKTIAAVAAGYRAPDDAYQHAKKSRFPKEEIIHYI